MPRPRFRPLTAKNLARTMVSILAMTPEDRETIAYEIANDANLVLWIQTHVENRKGVKYDKPAVTAENLGEIFDAVLNLSRDLREGFALGMNVVLDYLLRQDAFGTEGQCDPRGDHRD